MKCNTEIQRIAEAIERRGATLGVGGSASVALRDVNHDKWVQERDFMPPKRRPDTTPITFVMSSEAYEDPLSRKKSEGMLSNIPRVTPSRGGTTSRPLPKSYYCAISEMSVAPPHTVSTSHSLSDDRSAAAMQLVASRLQSRNCGKPSFRIVEAKAVEAV